MTAPTQPDPLDAPDWLNELLHPYCANSPLVAAVVWAAITERVNEAQANSDGYGPFFDAPYLIERLGGFPDELGDTND